MTQRNAGDAVVAAAIVAASTQPSVGSAGNNNRARIESATGAAPGAAVSRDGSRATVAGANAAPTPPAANAAAAAIVGGDAGALVAGGAVVAGATARRDTNPPFALQQAQPVSQQPVAGEALFEKSRIACLEASGYAAQ